MADVTMFTIFGNDEKSHLDVDIEISKFHRDKCLSLVEVLKFSGKVIVLTKHQTIRTSHLEYIDRRNFLTKSCGQQIEHSRNISKNIHAVRVRSWSEMNFIHLLAVITIIPLCMSWSSFFPTQIGQPGDLEYGKGNTEFLGNFTCSLNKVWCIHVEYVELDFTFDDGLGELPFVCVNGSTVLQNYHFANLSGTEKWHILDRSYDPGMVVLHDCTENGRVYQYVHEFPGQMFKYNCSNYKYSLDLVEMGKQREEMLYYHAGDYQKIVREWIMQHVTKVPLPGLENAVRPPWNSLPPKFPTSLCLGEMDDETPYSETLQYYEALYFNYTTDDTTTSLNLSSSTIMSPEMSSSSGESSIVVSNSTMT
ncbi:hypothetical protein GCK72_022541 [Caenorhabditis remanei]|uniref:Uncharacterized protein n=1 Tax=Caenorhabditis remanei TaxID=31234 RepID=A0A6A5FUD7_CAERE|nr:hypothetical protein GCK72_022541 [Caenorhabditis remanei]KAF1746089.1 hypothetical protein GCK72_022541 [Caenorhabditis remanei]